MTATAAPPSGNVFDVLHDAAALLDTLSEAERKQAVAFLASRYGVQIKEAPAPRAGGKRYSPKRSY